MKFLTVLVAGLLGGLIGAGVVYFVQPATNLAGHTVAPAVPDAGKGDGSALHAENDALRARLDSMERTLNEKLIANERAATTETPDLAALRAELMNEVKAQVQAETKAAVNKGTSEDPSAPSIDPLDREGLISKAYNDLNSTDPATRREAVRILRSLKVTEASDKLVEALGDPELRVQQEAAKFFEEYWNDAALEPLVKVMNGPDPQVGEQALDAIAKAGTDPAQRELENYFMNGTDLELAYEAGKALEENDRRTMLPSGVQRFRDALGSADPNERELAISGVKRWGTPEDESLIRALENDPHPGVRDEARKALKSYEKK